MLSEMIKRDQNRCAVGYWGVTNETQPSKNRNEFLTSLLETGESSWTLPACMLPLSTLCTSIAKNSVL